MFEKMSGMLNTALMCVVVILELTILGLDQGITKGFETLDHVGSFLGGIAGLTAAGIALMGFDVWKRQLTHGKYLTLIWEAMVSTQRLQTHLSLSSINLVMRYHTSNNEHFINEVLADRGITEGLIASLYDSCLAIDVLAARNGVELSNICSFLKARLGALERFADDASQLASSEDIITWTEKLSELLEPVKQEAELLRRKLTELEKRYG